MIKLRRNFLVLFSNSSIRIWDSKLARCNSNSDWNVIAKVFMELHVMWVLWIKINCMYHITFFNLNVFWVSDVSEDVRVYIDDENKFKIEIPEGELNNCQFGIGSKTIHSI